MKAKEIFDTLINAAKYPMSPTCDVLISGDENKEVKKAATCFKLTADVLSEAIKQGVDLIITHEPSFSVGDVPDGTRFADTKKWELLKESGVTLYRFHDHAHNSDPDYIHEGFLRKTGLSISKRFEQDSFAVSRYELSKPMELRSIVGLIHEKLGLEIVRVIGDDECIVKTVCLGLGAVGAAQFELLHTTGCELFITGEAGEVCACELVRDMCFFGEKKAMLLLGHYGAEYAGMELLAEKMNSELVSTIFIDGGEVYKTL